jgi:hypothetical protein
MKQLCSDYKGSKFYSEPSSLMSWCPPINLPLPLKRSGPNLTSPTVIKARPRTATAARFREATMSSHNRRAAAFDFYENIIFSCAASTRSPMSGSSCEQQWPPPCSASAPPPPFRQFNPHRPSRDAHSWLDVELTPSSYRSQSQIVGWTLHV